MLIDVSRRGADGTSARTRKRTAACATGGAAAFSVDGLVEALALDIGLGIFYAGYTYLFHLGFDRLRPVAPGGVLVG